MEPLAIQSGVSPTARPTLSLQADLPSVLSEGRVVAGEVLQVLDGGSILVGIGRHRVPAQSQVELAEGERFLARVEGTRDAPVLRLITPGEKAEPKLISALRAVVGEERPIGELLRSLADALRAALSESGPERARLQDLLASIGRHVFRPGSNAAELQALLARAGLGYEAALLAASFKAREPHGEGELLARLAESIVRALGDAASSVQGALSTAALARLSDLVRAALRELFGAPHGIEEGEEPARLLEAALARALGRLPAGAARERLLASLPDAVRRALESEPAAPRALSARSSGASELGRDLKAELLGTLRALSAGPAREAVARTLAGVESEQLLNLARKEFDQAGHLSFPVPDGEGWASAHLFHWRSGSGGDGAGGGEHEGEGGDEGEMERLTLVLELERLGPLRADLGLRRDELALRLAVERPQTAERLRAALPELSERLALGGRPARVSVVVVPPEEAAVDPLARDVRWLCEHHLMDLSG